MRIPNLSDWRSGFRMPDSCQLRLQHLFEIPFEGDGGLDTEAIVAYNDMQCIAGRLPINFANAAGFHPPVTAVHACRRGAGVSGLRQPEPDGELSSFQTAGPRRRRKPSSNVQTLSRNCRRF